MLNREPSLRSVAGWLFKHYAQAYFSDPTRNPFQAYRYGDPNPYHICMPAELITSSDMTAIQPRYNFYWLPEEHHFKGVDAVIRAGNIVWALHYTIRASQDSATDGLAKVYDSMNHKAGVQWRPVIVGTQQYEAESFRNYQVLGDRWMDLPVYACELPLGEFTKRDGQRLQDILNTVST